MSNPIYNWHKYVSTKKTNSNNIICPFAKNAKFIILKGDINFIEEQIFNWDNELDVIIVEYTKYITPTQAQKLEDRLNTQRDDVVILIDHYEDPGYIGGTNTSCGHNKILFLIQNKYKLNEARNTLEKTNYYDNWSKEYKEKIWRNK